ncbi:hypothetical protein BDZ90DRAFT_233766 [Jaminaea rosea]|uniref:Uncharacterized protein n=1 Tax=Jaminaea rosea TaxID=1569628 RepID=A0A316UKG2_9BASI|nr:hypothetical protein BDZ90DRAFT_233766 [Jaminaea rosea]PWN25756.1 hypothetical protein BDZ90DRAFT_233766 [Jaminaea rosea]
MSAIPPEELPILESLINIRNRLTALKKNSSEFIRAQDVQTLYQAVIKQVTKLNAVRDEREASEVSSRSGQASTAPSTEATPASSTSSCNTSTRTDVDTSATQHNRVDTTLQDVFSLLSLFFLTIGKSRETPATFSQLGSMKQLLDHMAESGIYTEADLEPFEKRLSELREIIRRDSDQGKHPAQLTKLMMRRLEGCAKVLQQLQGTLSVLSVELVPIHQKLVSIRRQIAAAAARPKPARQEIRKLQDELRAIDGKRVDGKFLGPGGSSVPAGQAILVGLLEECFEICHDVVVRNDEVPMTLQPIYDRLSGIKGQLEHLVLTHRWTLRETDLWNYQVTLKEIDRLRVDGKFVDSEGKQPEGQLVLLYLLRRCYGLIYRLVASSEPISEELMPVSNKLSTVSKCLKEVSKYGGPFTMRDLYPYRLALHQIDNLKSPVLDKDGNDTGVRKWLGRDGSVPEGQAILKAQFEEVEQTINEMLNQEEESDDDDEEGAEGSEGDWGAGSDISGSVSDDAGVASDSMGFNSGVQSRDISMPASPSGEVASPGVSGLSSALLTAGYGFSGSNSPTTPHTAKPNVAETSAQASPSVAPRPPEELSPASGSTSTATTISPGLSSNPLPPGAATLAVPRPGQTSLTAAAVSLDAMSGAGSSPPTHAAASNGLSPPMAPHQWAHLRDSAPSTAAISSTGASAASSSGESTNTTAAAAAGNAPSKASVPAPAAPVPIEQKAQHICSPGEAGMSPGSLEGESRVEVAKQLEAKLRLEDS